MLTPRIRWLTAGALVVLGGITSGSADASTINVTAAIKAQDGAIRRLPANKQLDAHLLKTTTVPEAKKLVALIGPLITKTDHAIDVVAQSSTTSPAQKNGKTEWVAASRQQVKGILEYRSALEGLIAGNQSVFRAADAKAKKLIAESVIASAKADKLLGISIND